MRRKAILLTIHLFVHCARIFTGFTIRWPTEEQTSFVVLYIKALENQGLARYTNMCYELWRL